MRILYLTVLLIFPLHCLSQVPNSNSSNENCNFRNNKLWVFSENIADTIYLKSTFRNKISEEFSYSDLIRVAYKKEKNKKYSKSYDIKPEEPKSTQGYIHFLYEIIKPCLLKYEKIFYENNIEDIKKLKSNHISYYYYNVSLIIVPKVE